MREIDVEELHALYDDCERSSFRIEARNRYEVPWEEEDLKAFAEGHGEPLGEDMKAKHEWIPPLVEAGRWIARVHVLDRPLTPYLEWELAAYRYNIEAGEDIRIADRSWHPDLAQLTEDFVIFDAETDHPSVIFYDYDQEDRLLGYRYTDSPEQIERCRRQRDIALEHAVDLDEFEALLEGR